MYNFEAVRGRATPIVVALDHSYAQPPLGRFQRDTRSGNAATNDQNVQRSCGHHFQAGRRPGPALSTILARGPVF
jgi:hypothetical protein